MVQFAVQKKYSKQKSNSSINVAKKTKKVVSEIPVLFFWIFF
jgi:hypothetical protein